MKIYFTSDWHIGHKNILQLDQRPFSNLEDMHDTLVSNFNSVVGRNDVTYFLGDMGLCSTSLLGSVINRLNGIRILIRGNHDRNINAMYSAGFHAVTEKAQFSIGEHIITMSHCPLIGVPREETTTGENWHNEQKYGKKFAFEDIGQYHLHGHIHSSPLNKKKKILGRQMDVGVAAWHYKPVSWDDIQSFIAKSK